MTEAPTVHVAMGRVLAALPAIGKNQRNQQQGFNFRGIDDVLNALNPLLSEHGVVIVPHRVVERVAGQRTTAKGGVMYEVGLHVQYRIYGPAGDFIEAEAWGEGTDSGDKATPKAMTGAYKYMLFEAFSISTEEASKTDADRHTPEPSVRNIDCPEACGHSATKAAMRGHLLDAHGWHRTDDGRVIRPAQPPAAGSTGPIPDNGAHDASPGAGTPGAGGGEAAHGAPDAAPSPAPTPKPPGPSPKQLGLMHVLLGKLGVPESDKHRFCSALIDMPEPMESLSDLTGPETRRLLDALQAEAGEPAK